MTKHYTELTGAVGGRIQFGIRQHDVSALFGSTPPIARVGLSQVALRRLSTLGVTFSGALPAGLTSAEAEETLRLELSQGDKTLVARDISTPQRLSEGEWECTFLDRAVDLEALVDLNASAVARTRARVATAPKAIDVSTEYKVFCADVLDYLGSIRAELESEVAPVMDNLSKEEMASLDREVLESVSAHWAEKTRQANRLLLPLAQDKKALQRHKSYTENVLTREMCQSPLWNRCFVKPMGYPGDYQIMNAFYDNVVLGEDPYTRFLEVLGLLSGGPVVTRMQWMVERLKTLRLARDEGDHLHIMSIGAGSAREVRELFKSSIADGVGYSFTLVDAEEKALEYALPSIYGGVQSGLSSVMVSGMNTSFMEMLKPNVTFRHLPPQDFIYSAGLTDYLGEKLTRSLIRKLYDFLKPGGSVVIGNINAGENGMFWAAECVLDWTMHFRTLSDMERIAEGLEGEVVISQDPSGSYYMLEVTKPL